MISESSVSSRDMESPDNDDDHRQHKSAKKRKSNDGRKMATKVAQSDDEVKSVKLSSEKRKKKKKKKLDGSKKLDKGNKEQNSLSKRKQKKDKELKKTLTSSTSSSSTSHMKAHKELLANKTAGCQQSIESKESRKSSHKRRFEEMVIDGLTISAFKTWEDLQDDVNERLAKEAHEMRQRTGDHLQGSHSSIEASEEGHSSSSQSPSVTSNRDQSSPQQLQQSLPNQKQREFESQSCSSNRAKGSSYEDPGLREALEAKAAAERHLMEVQDRLQQQEQRKKKHDVSRQHRDKIGPEFVARQQFSTNFAPGATNRHHLDTSFYPFQPPPPPYPQTRVPPAPFSGTQHSHGIQYNFNNTNNINEFKPLAKEGGGPSVPIHQQPSSLSSSNMQPRGPPQMNTQQQQYFQQYLNSQLYQQHQQQQSRETTSTHQSHFVPPPQPPPPPAAPPHMPTMNHSYVSPHHLQQQNHLHHSSLMATGSLHQHPAFSSPYTITDTIISRQTSIIPPNLASMNAALAASGRLGQHYPQALGALEHNSLSLLGSGGGGGGSNSGYIPSPTERSFMEFARSYASASNISGMMPGGNFGPPGSPLHPSSLDRFSMEHRIASSFGGGGGLPDPMSRLGMPGYGIEAARSAVNAASSFYPPNFYR